MRKSDPSHAVRRCVAMVALLWGLTAAVPAADEPASAVGSVMKLLKSGRVPEERLGAIVDIVGTRGNQNDLAELFGRAVGADWPLPLRRRTMSLLVEAAEERNVVPSADLSALGGIISDPATDIQLRRSAVRLAGAARAAGVTDALMNLAMDANGEPSLRASSLNSLVAIQGAAARPVIDSLLTDAEPYAIRGAALAALAETDLSAAAVAGADLLTKASPDDDPGPVVDALLNRTGGADKLASAVAKSPPPTDVAKLALRHIYSIGRSDDALVSALGSAAGIEADPQPLTEPEFAALVEEVRTEGDAARGEEVFRRNDLSCMKCHSVSAAGGQVGPDLSAVGSISPIDYLLNSILNPDLAIKEAYITRVVATVEGEIVQGIVVERSAEKLVLKDATGVVRTIAAADIDQEVEGKSLMPKGLVRFMTHQELVDLAKFLSQLGRPGDYAIRTTPRFQRYRVLAGVSSELTEAVPNDEQFEASVYRAESWRPFYARSTGAVPLAEAKQIAGTPVFYLYGDFEVTEEGPIGVLIDSSQGVHAWIDDASFELKGAATLSGQVGTHRITLRVDTNARDSGELRLELRRVEGSPAEFRPVDGA